MLFAALLRCTSYNGNAIFSGNQSISFAQDSKVRAGLDGSRIVSRSRRTRRFAQVSTVRAGLDGSRRQNSTVRAGLDGSRRTRQFAQDSTVLADRTRPFWPLRRLIAGSLDSESEHSLVFSLITFCIFIDLPHGLSRWMMECALKSFAWHLLSLEPFPSVYNSVRHFAGRRRTLVKTTHYHSNTNKVAG